MRAAALGQTRTTLRSIRVLFRIFERLLASGSGQEMDMKSAGIVPPGRGKQGDGVLPRKAVGEPTAKRNKE
jgi:hypothetical protein